MASGVKVEFKHSIGGIRTVFKSDGMRSALHGVVDPIADTATGIAASNETSSTRGARYVGYVDIGKFSAIGKVVCGNAAARHDNANNNTILKAR